VIELSAPGVTATVDPAAGGRLASLCIDGFEVLVDRGDHPMLWGSFPMVPWAGRVRRGRFRFEGVDHQLECDLPPHAIHGTCYRRPWQQLGPAALEIDLGDGWPFPGTARQHFSLDEASITCTLEVHATEVPFPATAGWHPWFRKPSAWTVPACHRCELDDEGIPTGRLVAPERREGDWDDCVTNLAAPVTITFPGGPTLAVVSPCAWWVLFDRMDHGRCVEPQTGPPDGLTLLPYVVSPGHPLVASMTIAWG
jgi:aldose 1-epimerase